MTSFERFQRNARSKVTSHPLNSKTSHFSEQSDQNQPPLVTFSKNTIRFLYNPTKSSFRQSMDMRNESGQKIYFKVRCNNPKNYIVTPYEQVIDHQQKINLKFQFLPTSADFNLYKNNKFQIIWGQLPSFPGSPPLFTHSMKFPVEILSANVDTEEEMLESVNNTAHFTSEVSSYCPSVDDEEREEGKGREENNQTLLTKPIMMGVAAVSFLIGFIVG